MALTTATSQQTTNSTTSTVTLPAHAAGDLLIALVAADSGALTSTWTAGWTEIKDEAGTGFVFTAAWKKAASSSEPNPVATHTSERSNHIAIRIPAAEWDGTAAPEITTGVGGSSSSPDPGASTPSWGSMATTWIAVSANDDSAAPTYIAFPASYTTNNLQNGTATSAARIAIATRVGWTAATEDPGAFTLSGTETWRAYTIAVKPAAGGIALIGSSAGTASASAALTTSIPLVGSSAGAGTAASVLSTSIHFAGSADGTGAATGSLSTSISLVGASAGASLADGLLTTAIPLVGSSAGTGTAGGALTSAADTALAGSSAGVGAASASLTTEIRFAGSSAGAGTVAGALTTAISLAGSSAGAGTAGGVLTTSGDTALAGSSAGLAAASAVLTTSIALAGSIAGTASALAALLTAIPLLGSSAGTGTAGGSLLTAIALGGAADGLAVGSGSLTTQISLVGAAGGSSTATGIFSALLIAGYTRNSGGAIIANAVVDVFVASTNALYGSTTSDGTGHYSIEVLSGVAYFLVAYDLAADVYGVTARDLVGV